MTCRMPMHENPYPRRQRHMGLGKTRQAIVRRLEARALPRVAAVFSCVKTSRQASAARRLHAGHVALPEMADRLRVEIDRNPGDSLRD